MILSTISLHTNTINVNQNKKKSLDTHKQFMNKTSPVTILFYVPTQTEDGVPVAKSFTSILRRRTLKSVFLQFHSENG